MEDTRDLGFIVSDGRVYLDADRLVESIQSDQDEELSAGLEVAIRMIQALKFTCLMVSGTGDYSNESLARYIDEYMETN